MTPILVTGSAKGLGAEVCRQLAAQGHDLVIHYRSSEKQALQVAEECRGHGICAEIVQGDFSTLESTQSFIAGYSARFPETKGLVNNVGNYLLSSSEHTQTAQWLEIFQTNFFAPVFLVQALLPSLKRHKGCIVNMGVTGLRAHRASIKATAYTATKSALHFYTISLAKELAEEAVRVNMVSPGYVENAIDLNDPPKLPFKRPAYFHEVAHAVVSFFDPRNSYVTGQNLEVAGGIGL